MLTDTVPKRPLIQRLPYIQNRGGEIPNFGILEIQNIIIDMFCGAGGTSLGFAAMAKATGAFRLIGGVDVNEASLKTYEHNYGVPACKIDVREITRLRCNCSNSSNRVRTLSGLYSLPQEELESARHP